MVPILRQKPVLAGRWRLPPEHPADALETVMLGPHPIGRLDMFGGHNGRPALDAALTARVVEATPGVLPDRVDAQTREHSHDAVQRATDPGPPTRRLSLHTLCRLGTLCESRCHVAIPTATRFSRGSACGPPSAPHWYQARPSSPSKGLTRRASSSIQASVGMPLPRSSVPACLGLRERARRPLRLQPLLLG